MNAFRPDVIQKYVVKVKQEKADVVRKLLEKHFGLQWEQNEELIYFKIFFKEPTWL